MSGERRGRLGVPAGHALHPGASLRVLRRFAFKCVLFSAWAGVQGLFGLGFFRPLALMALISAILCMGLGLRNRERIAAPHWTSFDEAAWFLSMGAALRAIAT